MCPVAIVKMQSFLHLLSNSLEQSSSISQSELSNSLEQSPPSLIRSQTIASISHHRTLSQNNPPPSTSPPSSSSFSHFNSPSIKNYGVILFLQIRKHRVKMGCFTSPARKSRIFVFVSIAKQKGLLLTQVTFHRYFTQQILFSCSCYLSIMDFI